MRLEVGRFYTDLSIQTPAGLIELHNVTVLDRISREDVSDVVLSVSPSVCPEDWVIEATEGDAIAFEE
jgi:hypothetical protein